mmetsp:Transcript_51270/g.121833  ORF Transcript_51270/g.121833 Transcript_51270/m.121833 type:complete len:228 (-) Transcript_51270:908-1591(-)
MQSGELSAPTPDRQPKVSVHSLESVFQYLCRTQHGRRWCPPLGQNGPWQHRADWPPQQLHKGLQLPLPVLCGHSLNMTRWLPQLPSRRRMPLPAKDHRACFRAGQGQSRRSCAHATPVWRSPSSALLSTALTVVVAGDVLHKLRWLKMGPVQGCEMKRWSLLEAALWKWRLALVLLPISKLAARPHWLLLHEARRKLRRTSRLMKQLKERRKQVLMTAWNLRRSSAH